MLEVSGYVDATDTVFVLVKDSCDIFHALIFRYRKSSVDVDVMPFLYMIQDILESFELGKWLTACQHYIIMRENAMHKIEGSVTPLQIE
jgi:hypothetical protein